VISRSLNRNDEEEEEHRSAVLQVRNAQTLHKRGKLIKNKRKTLVNLTSGYEMDLTKKRKSRSQHKQPTTKCAR